MRVLITGKNGLMARSIQDKLSLSSENPHISWEFVGKDSFDLRNSEDTEQIFKEVKPDYVIHTAATVGGIKFNIENPEKLLHENLLIDSHVISNCIKYDVQNLIYFGSSCMYSPTISNNFKEDDLDIVNFEKTNENYALAKYVGMKLVETYRTKYNINYSTLVLSNLYGVYDNFTNDSSHVLSAAIRKIYHAKKNSDKFVTAWGTGKPRREFTFAEDVANWLVDVVLRQISLPSRLNLGLGRDYSIEELYLKISAELGFTGKLLFDDSKLDGIPKKLMNSDLAKENFFWDPKYSLEDGLKKISKYILRGEIKID